ncbi:hypothetical protein GCM10010869_28260 [Mesorhizobium tianshanense]|nr:hypothetical protein GCM10010869_28260 [Mesorhizobium tianshanense]
MLISLDDVLTGFAAGFFKNDRIGCECVWDDMLVSEFALIASAVNALAGRFDAKGLPLVEFKDG